MDSDIYPHLYEANCDQSHPLNGRETVIFGVNERGEVSPDVNTGLLFRVEAEDGRWFICPLADGEAISLNQVAIQNRTPLEHLAIVQAKQRVFVFLEHDDPNTATAYSANLWLVTQLLRQQQPTTPDTVTGSAFDPNATLQFSEEQVQKAIARGGISPVNEEIVPLELPGAIELPEQRIFIGRDPQKADVCFPDVRVSRVHASIVRDDNTARITDLKSENKTFVDGEEVVKPTVVREGSRIQIGPYTLIFRGTALYPISHDNNVELVARNLFRRVPDRKKRGTMKIILNDVSLVIRPREFACILGPSGSGKTTLLSALSARVRADEGTVLLNDDNLYAHFDALKQNLAVVPQRDVLHDVLPLNRALWYTAKLRLPADMSNDDIEGRIDETLDTVSLVQRQYTRIQQLSGGQIKRASWANETISNPSLIFLDEVTSGLDEQSDYEMMQLFRRMADDGKTIVCITHNLSNVALNCHLVVILAEGGSLAFMGSPAEALDYFDISELSDVYQRLKERLPEDWQERFRKSKAYQKYVARRLPDDQGDVKHVAKRRRVRELLTVWRQFHLLSRRYLAIQAADKRALAMIFGQCIVIAGLLVWLFGDISKLDVNNTVAQREAMLFELEFGYALDDMAEDEKQLLEEDEAYVELRDKQRKELTDEAELEERTDLSSKLLFLLCISCIWFGCNNAAKEIVKERTIYEKERDAGLKVLSYFGSKFAPLGVLSVLQVSLFFWIVDLFTHLSGGASQQWMLLCLSALTGVAMGLAISAIATSEDLAVTIVPMALIPQIILAGLIAPLMNYTREFSQVCIPAYWGYQGLLTSLDGGIQERLRDASYLSLDATWTPAWTSAALGIYIVVFSIAAIAALYREQP